MSCIEALTTRQYLDNGSPFASCATTSINNTFLNRLKPIMSTNIQPHSIPSTRGAVFPHLLTVPPFALPVAKTKPSSSPSSTAPSTPNPNEERHWVKITSGNNTGILAKHPSSDRSGALRDSGVSLPARPSSSISSSSGSKSRTSSSGSSIF
ncbi:SubName: Full=Uncharacterized protein {ECO:0000313/EMBL:CCA69338.1} [Serendipita indica DSM 11827]|nr:SubName: Full=Uncharacterized protein {ECO:0000313/EMBL:CCA69338.1} [Serendipita indica DSM 11827]